MPDSQPGETVLISSGHGDRAESRALVVAAQFNDLSIKVAGHVQQLQAMERRFDDARLADGEAARAASVGVSDRMTLMTQLLEEKLSGVDHRLADRVASAENALRLQAAEYSRRFDILDRGQSELVRALDQRLPREVFDRSDQQYRPWHDSVDAQLNIQRGRDNGTATYIAIVLAVLALLAQVLPFILSRSGG